ncbi:hypothetical protein AB0N87_43250 [Streptomyces sp. NPDC093228]|uniref:hypothetical protein n=1 Tax=Streptomyces sp. NPDC093228 TaxID=3155070 RepID=UPI0034252DBC
MLSDSGVSEAVSSGAGVMVPRLCEGLELLGEYQGSGSVVRKFLLRRGDGQVIQVSRLLYLVAGSVDGVRDAEAISHRVSGRYGQEVSAEDVLFLVERKLTPMGVTLPPGGDGRGSAPRSDLLLALKGHRVVFGERWVARIAGVLGWLHSPLVVSLVLVAAVVMDGWLFGVHGGITAVLQVLEQPLWMLILFGLTVASLVFHEFGHASACHYSGAVPGKIGCGIFLIWPSMYTDVTDVYRVGRAGRLRTGLGGVYFNVIFMLVLTGLYLVTGQPLFLAAVYLAHFEVLEQLMPLVRLDGYYILGDLAGVPDLYGKVKPILMGLLPGRRREAAAMLGLKRSARIVVTVWVAVMVPLLLAEVGYVLWNLPRLVATAGRALAAQVSGTLEAFAGLQVWAGLVGVIGTLMLLCPMAGGCYLAGRIVVRVWRAGLRVTEGQPVMRLAVVGAVVAVGAVLGVAWVRGLTPKPLPAAAPVTPVLQPGVPAPHPAPTTSTAGPSPAPSHPARRPAVPPSGRPATVTPPAASSAAPASSSPATVSRTPSASPTRTHPTPDPSGSSPTPSATGTPPTGSPSPSPSPSASTSPTRSPSPSGTSPSVPGPPGSGGT